MGCELSPGLWAWGPRHPLAYQKQKGPSNGLVVKLRFAFGDGELDQRRGKALKGFQRRVPAQVQEGDADMFGVVKGLAWKAGVLEARDEFVVAHGFLFLRAGVDPASVRRWLAAAVKSR